MLNTSKLPFKLLLLFLVPLQQVAIDIYLPSLPALTQFMHASQAQVQMTLALYLLGLGIGQGIYGMFSDYLGRKPVLLFGLSLFCLATVVCVLSNSIGVLLLARIIQGLGIGCGFVTVSAIISDCYDGYTLNRMTALSTTAFALAPIIAPVIGGYLQTYIGWQASFYLLLIYGVVLLVMFAAFLPETNKQKTKVLSIKPYSQLVKSQALLTCTICLMLTFGMMIIFNILGPFILENQFGLSAIVYGNCALFIGIAYLAGTIINHSLLKYFSLDQLIFLGLSLMLLGSIFLIVFNFLYKPTAISIVFWISVAIFGTGFVFPNSYAKALALFPTQAGTASAFMGLAALFGIFIFSAIISHIPVLAIDRLVGSFLIITLLTWMTYYWGRRLSVD